jgi:hypothetical protein
MANCRYCGLRNAIRYHHCIHCGTPFKALRPFSRSLLNQPSAVVQMSDGELRYSTENTQSSDGTG